MFLDEIGELPLGVQGKLLRAIEEKVVDRIGGRAPVAVDVRVVAATNKDLKRPLIMGSFVVICSSVWRCFRSKCRRCASVATTSCCSPSLCV